LYVAGGRLGTFARNLDVNNEYDPATNQWRKRAPMPTARSGIAGAVLNNMFFVFGGESPLGTFNQNEAYDPAQDRWTSYLSMPTARHGLGAVTFQNAIYVLAGGRTPGGSESNLVEIFSLQ
jgi:N-acetylneuraminic acid mutarotase